MPRVLCRQSVRGQSIRRQGVTSMLAMLFVVLFAALAIGFYTTTTTAIIVTDNERRALLAHTSAEGGVEFIRFQLEQISIPAGTPPDQIFAYVANELKDNLEGTANLAGHTVAVTSSSVSIPADPDGYVPIDGNGAEFRAELASTGGDIRAKVIGRHGGSNARRAIRLDFERAERPKTVFSFAIAARGRVVMSRGAITGFSGVSEDKIASVMSADPRRPAITVTGGTIGGDLSVTADGLVNVSGGSVGGTSSTTEIRKDHTHVVDPLEFPRFDTNHFKQYVTSTYTGGSTLKNVRIPAGTNPRFTGGAVIQGILYVESPNTIDFRGNVDLQGLIVFEDKGNSTSNVIDMRGNFTHSPLPPGSEFDALREVGGIAVLAPRTSLIASGSADSNLVGNVIVGSFANGGSADWTVEKGTLMTMDDTTDSAVFNGKTMKFKSVGSALVPTHGLIYSTYFKPDHVTYEEVLP